MDMLYVRCPKKRAYVGLLSPLVVSLKDVIDLSRQVIVITVFDRPYDILPFLENLRSSGTIATSPVEC